MKKKKLYLIIFGIVLVILLVGTVRYFYHSGEEYPVVMENKQKSSNNLDDVNRFLVEKDRERIQSFVERREWEMKKTGSGLWYQIISDNKKGKKIEEGDKVKINYEIRLLDGTLCYTSDSTGAKEFVVGHQETMLGLQEGIKLLSEGEQARFIIPPHLGYGLIGDEERIPARAVLVYRLEVTEVNNR